MLAALPEGTLFARRYRVIRCLATGGMGAVYEVEHLETARRRALKVMHPHLFQSQDMRERFQREARIAASIESEHIVDVFDAGVDEATGVPFLVMELLRGEELGKRVTRLGRLPVGEALTYLQQAAVTLDRTHAASIIHRDLKPENLFVTFRDDGTPRLRILDFGIAKVIADGASRAGTTQTLGTPLYMAPEQLLVGSKLTGAADIYALGMIAYTLLVGEPYWANEARNAGEVLAFAMVAVQGPQESAAKRAAAVGVGLPPAFDAWFARVTARQPEKRFKTATEAVGALREALGPGQTVALPAGVAVPARAPAGLTPVPGAIPTQVLEMNPATPARALERASTSTSAAVSAAQEKHGRRPAVVAAASAAVITLAGVGAATWWWLGSGSPSNPGTTTSSEAAAPMIDELGAGATAAAATTPSTGNTPPAASASAATGDVPVVEQVPIVSPGPAVTATASTVVSAAARSSGGARPSAGAGAGTATRTGSNAPAKGGAPSGGGEKVTPPVSTSTLLGRD